MKRILILSTLILLFISCQKREWGNPFDPNCPKELFTPASFTATQMGDSIVLSWSQPNNQISGFVLEKNTADGSFTQLANPEKSTTKVADRNIEGGIKYVYQLYASAGSNTSNTVTVEITPLLNAKITTTAYTNITATSAIAGGNITADGGAAITARGVCWSTTENPTIANSKTNDGTGKGSFTSNVTGLTAGTVYYARAYATNSVGTAYGNQVTTTTVTILPTITTTILSAVTATTITGGGNITSDGGASVTARGVCWSTTQNPTTANSKTTDGTGTGSFTSSISGLSPGVTYYIKAYAINNVGTVYGTEITITTTAISPVITTATVSAITATTVTSGGNILSDGGATLTERGVCWSTSQNPTISDNKTTNSTGSGIFVSSITGLTPGVTYYLRAYATNSVGTSYGNQLTAATNATVSTLTTTTPSAITSSTVSTGGNITSDGGAAVTARGVCWGTTANPTTANSKTVDGSGIGSFTSNIAGLTPGTTYYTRAYATNSIGTVYGNDLTCTTTAVLPLITTTIISSITSNTATSGGNITNDGGSAITARGVCWSTAQNPTISNFKTADSSGAGSFISSITGLVYGTTYYIRAYATNGVGTVYGNELSIATLATLPVLTSTTVTAITSTTATSGGNITSDGGAVVTVSGICWSTTQNPTISNSKTTNGTTSGSFTSSIIGLAPGTSYYIRAYATNNIGTVYGNQVGATTLTALAVLTTAATTLITSTSTSSGGDITSDGGAIITARGVCWSTSQNPTTSNYRTTDGTGSSSYVSNITGLAPVTTYYTRAYATNSIGTAYGNEVTATTTKATPPVITTSTLFGITATTATSGGNITNDGGATVTFRGVCWSLRQSPTITDSKTTDGAGIGSFDSSINGLTPGETYYFKAYATNSVGTSYGNEISFTSIIPLAIGDSYQGGKVAYFFQFGDPGYIAGETHGLIAAPNDQSEGIQWYNGSNITTLATGFSLGEGNTNTNIIVSIQGTGSYAAHLCSDLVLGGYSDWYLPSRNELDKLRINMVKIGVFISSKYWSSSEVDNINAYTVEFGQPNPYDKGIDNKSIKIPTRAVRSF